MGTIGKKTQRAKLTMSFSQSLSCLLKSTSFHTELAVGVDRVQVGHDDSLDAQNAGAFFFFLLSLIVLFSSLQLHTITRDDSFLQQLSEVAT